MVNQILASITRYVRLSARRLTMIEAWVGIIAGILIVAGGIGAIVYNRKHDFSYRSDAKWWLIGGIVAILAGLIMSLGSAFWLYGTEAGARAQKSWSSTTGGGLTRVVKHYDTEGDLIEEYRGKFDVDANAERIIFDVPQADGSYKRVQIWPGMGSVTIREE